MFDTVIAVDWSGGNDRGPTPKQDAIWTSVATGGRAAAPIYHRNRIVAEAWLTKALQQERDARRRCLVVFDLCFAYPAGFAAALTGTDDPFAVWEWFADRVADAPKANNRFDLAGEINSRFDGIGPFWGNGLARDIPYLPRKGLARTCDALPEKRKADAAAKGAFSPWQLAGAGAVGSQVIMGMPMLHRLRRQFQSDVAVWPFEAADRQIVLAETYFSLTPKALATAPDHGGIKDAAQVALYATLFSALSDREMGQVLDHPPQPEGWVLGLGHQAMLEAVAAGVFAA